MNTLKGLNLGGWLVLERWMTPSLFKGTEARDEYDFMKTPGAQEKLKKHHKEFIKEEDFQWMQDNGVNAVRIPIGYWILDGDTPFIGCIDRLDWAVRMAKKYDIQVLICMHGAPGSQNGNDHSGRIGRASWYDAIENREKTVRVLRELAIRYRNDPTVWGIELLNEPKTKLFQPKLRAFYKNAYSEIIQVGRPGLNIVFSDAFTPRLLSGALSPVQNFPVVLDHHWYHFFIPGFLQSKINFSWYYRYLRYKRRLLECLERKKQPIIIGEWSGIIGGGKLGRYPKSQHEEIIDEHIKRQLESYKNLMGWFYWSYKHEHGGVFDFRDMVEHGRIKF